MGDELRPPGSNGHALFYARGQRWGTLSDLGKDIWKCQLSTVSIIIFLDDDDDDGDDDDDDDDDGDDDNGGDDDDDD